MPQPENPNPHQNLFEAGEKLIGRPVAAKGGKGRGMRQLHSDSLCRGLQYLQSIMEQIKGGQAVTIGTEDAINDH